MIRPTPSSTARAQLGDGLVVAVEADAFHREAGALGDGQLAAGAHVEAQPLLGDPPGDRRTEEGLARVVDVAVGEAVAEGAGAGAEVLLVQDVRRRPVLGDQVGQPDPADLERAVDLARRPDHSSGTSALGSSGSRSHAGPRTETAACAQPASCARTVAHIRSGADTPSSSRPFSKTMRVASTSTSRARCRSVTPRHPAAAPGSGRRTCGTSTRSPRGSGRPGAAPAAGGGCDHPRELGQRTQQRRPRARGRATTGRRPSERPRGRVALRRSMPCARRRTARRRRGCRSPAWSSRRRRGSAASRPGSAPGCSAARRRRSARRAPRGSRWCRPAWRASAPRRPAGS